MQPTRAILNLLCDLPPRLDPVINPWWDLHQRELLTLDGFLSARRLERIGGSGPGRILALYELAGAAAADQPRPAHFAVMPAELDGEVGFHRRILHLVGDAPAGPAGRALLQLIRPADPASLVAAAERVRTWPGVLSVSAWSNEAAVDFHRRDEVIQHGDADLLLADLDGPARPVGADLPGWTATTYRETFRAAPAPCGQVV